jgi:hypothetical protein
MILRRDDKRRIALEAGYELQPIALVSEIDLSSVDRRRAQTVANHTLAHSVKLTDVGQCAPRAARAV